MKYIMKHRHGGSDCSEERIDNDIPHKDDNKWRKNLEKYYDEVTVNIIVEAREKAHKDIKEGRIKVYK